MTRKRERKIPGEALKLLGEVPRQLTTDTPVTQELGKLVVFLRRARLPRAREVRHPGLAHAEIRPD